MRTRGTREVRNTSIGKRGDSGSEKWETRPTRLNNGTIRKGINKVMKEKYGRACA